MTKDDRVAFVLTVLEITGCAMRSVDIARNCKLRGATFEHRSVKNYLGELIERGDVIKVCSDALDDGRVVEIEPGERGHFLAASVATQYRGD